MLYTVIFLFLSDSTPERISPFFFYSSMVVSFVFTSPNYNLSMCFILFPQSECALFLNGIPAFVSPAPDTMPGIEMALFVQINWMHT